MITQFNREQLVKNLPDAYCKANGSNNEKILEIEKGEMDSIREAIRAIFNSLDLDNASGKTLDLYGEMLGQARGVATDEQYRVMLRSRIVRSHAAADYNSIVYAICETFGCDPSEVELVEKDACRVSLEFMPFEELNGSNIDVVTAVQIIKRLMPSGVMLESLNFAGTFEFAGEELVYDEAAGFGDEAQTMGGSLGLMSDGNGSNLPV